MRHGGSLTTLTQIKPSSRPTGLRIAGDDVGVTSPVISGEVEAVC